jgi:hypothetical protein
MKSDYDHRGARNNGSVGTGAALFQRNEDYQHGADELHGAGGERVEERRVNTSPMPGEAAKSAAFPGSRNSIAATISQRLFR